MKTTPIIIVVIILVLGIMFFVRDGEIIPPKESHAKTEAYIRARISELAPEKETLGGKFYVTEVTFVDDEHGLVKYEDGHMAYTAEFTYKVLDDSVDISSFENIPDSQLTQYRESELGISFAYPSNYHLEKKDNGDLVLSQGDAVIPANSEGPTSITISSYEKAGNQSLQAWITDSQESNYAIQGNSLREMNLAGKEAFRYSHSGLYEADAVVFEAKNGKVVMMAVTYLSPEDEIRKDFEDVLKTIVHF